MTTTTARTPHGRWDSTLPLLWYGYTFIPRECRRLGSDVFTTRLPGAQTICMQGGDAETSHRCAGEPITIAIIKLATKMLCRGMDYHVPSQDLTVDTSRVPTFPASGFVITAVAPREVAH